MYQKIYRTLRWEQGIVLEDNLNPCEVDLTPNLKHFVKFK